MILHRRPPRTIYDILSLTNSTLLILSHDVQKFLYPIDNFCFLFHSAIQEIPGLHRNWRFTEIFARVSSKPDDAYPYFHTVFKIHLSACLQNYEKWLLASPCLSVHPSIRVSVCQFESTRFLMEQFSSHFIPEYFSKICQENVSLKSNKNNQYFTWRPIYIYHNILLNSSQNEKSFRQICGENQDTHFMLNNFFSENHTIYEIIWKNYCWAREATDDNTIEHMCFAFWILKLQTYTQNI